MVLSEYALPQLLGKRGTGYCRTATWLSGSGVIKY